MTYCDNVVSVLSSRELMETVLYQYLTSNEMGEIVFDLEKISPIPSYFRCTWSSAFSEPDYYYLNYKDGCESAFGDWSHTHWGGDGYITDVCLSGSRLAFVTNESPPLGIIASLAELTDQVLRLTYSCDGSFGEILFYPCGARRAVHFASPDETPHWLKEEMGHEDD